MRIVISVCILVAIAVVALSGWIKPPLSAPPIERDDIFKTLDLSDPGYAGAEIFGRSCAECHGTFADGGMAPNLLTKSYAKDFREVRAFHERVGKRIPEHDAFLGRTDTEIFNKLELMATFLREVRSQAHKL